MRKLLLIALGLILTVACVKKSKYDSLKEELAALELSSNAEIKNLNDQLNAAQANIQNLQGQVNSLNNEIATLESNADAQASEIAILVEVRDGLEAEVSGLNEQLESLRLQLANANAAGEVKDSTIASLQNQIAALNGQVSSLGSENSRLVTELRIVSGSIAVTFDDIQGLEWDPAFDAENLPSGDLAQTRTPFVSINIDGNETRFDAAEQSRTLVFTAESSSDESIAVEGSSVSTFGYRITSTSDVIGDHATREEAVAAVEANSSINVGDVVSIVESITGQTFVRTTTTAAMWVSNNSLYPFSFGGEVSTSDADPVASGTPTIVQEAYTKVGAPAVDEWVDRTVSYTFGGVTYTTETFNAIYPGYSYVIDQDPLTSQFGYIIVDLSDSSAVATVLGNYSTREAAVSAAQADIAAR